MTEIERPELWTAVRAAQRAGSELASLAPERHRTKPNGDIVTEADRIAERIVLEEIDSEFPEHNVVSEESSPEFTTRPRWIVDPVDGTTNLLNGVPHFAVSIAFEGVRTADLGVVYHVPTETTFTAVEGEGAYANGQPLSVSDTAELSDALVVTGFDPASMDARDFEQFQAMLSATQGVRRFGSAASELSMVAAGRFDAFFERMLSVWDTAAGVVIVEEAGGEVTRIKALDGENSEMILASNEQIHQDLVALVSSGSVPE